MRTKVGGCCSNAFLIPNRIISQGGESRAQLERIHLNDLDMPRNGFGTENKVITYSSAMSGFYLLPIGNFAGNRHERLSTHMNPSCKTLTCFKFEIDIWAGLNIMPDQAQPFGQILGDIRIEIDRFRRILFSWAAISERENRFPEIVLRQLLNRTLQTGRGSKRRSPVASDKYIFRGIMPSKAT